MIQTGQPRATSRIINRKCVGLWRTRRHSFTSRLLLAKSLLHARIVRPGLSTSHSHGKRQMCNLYNITTNQEAIRAFANAARDIFGNMEPSLDIYPDRS